jgi:hypothetical protein
MRTTSKIFVLLLASSTLHAQQPAQPTQDDPNSIEMQLQHRIATMQLWESAHACPVGFSVNRKARGAVIWTGAESDWIRQHSTLSLPEMQRAYQSEPSFSQRSPGQQKDSLDRITRLYTMQHGQGLDLSFARPQAEIVAADVVVHGYPLTAHAIPATLSAPSEVTESFHLTASADEPLLHSSVWTAHMVVIKWAELTRLEYADGTTWTPAANQSTCRAYPRLYLPVNATAR